MKKAVLLSILMIFMLFSLTSCKVKKYSQIEDVEYKYILSKSNLSATSSYYVLVYRNGCSVCKELEPLVCEYANIVKQNPSIDKIYVLNKSDKKINGGISADAECVAIGAKDIDAITKFCVDNKIDFVKLI